MRPGNRDTVVTFEEHQTLRRYGVRTTANTVGGRRSRWCTVTSWLAPRWAARILRLFSAAEDGVGSNKLLRYALRRGNEDYHFRCALEAILDAFDEMTLAEFIRDHLKARA